jgi:hypothetical protein
MLDVGVPFGAFHPPAFVYFVYFVVLLPEITRSGIAKQ